MVIGHRQGCMKIFQNENTRNSYIPNIMVIWEYWKKDGFKVQLWCLPSNTVEIEKTLRSTIFLRFFFSYHFLSKNKIFKHKTRCRIIQGHIFSVVKKNYFPKKSIFLQKQFDFNLKSKLEKFELCNVSYQRNKNIFVNQSIV